MMGAVPFPSAGVVVVVVELTISPSPRSCPSPSSACGGDDSGKVSASPLTVKCRTGRIVCTVAMACCGSRFHRLVRRSVRLSINISSGHVKDWEKERLRNESVVVSVLLIDGVGPEWESVEVGPDTESDRVGAVLEAEGE